jgi:hypothetical protein
MVGDMSDEEELAALERDIESFVKERAPTQQHLDTLWERYYSRHDEEYRTVLGGHLMLEELIDQILIESFKEPETVLDFNFAVKLQILKALNPVENRAPVFDLVDKLNRLRNAVAHGDAEKRGKTIQQIEQAVRQKYAPDDSLINKTGTLLAFAFGVSSANLEEISKIVGLRNRAQKLGERLGPRHPVGDSAFRLLKFFNTISGKEPV